MKSALTFEDESSAFYHEAIQQVTDKKSKELLTYLYNDERVHKEKLVSFLEGDIDTVIDSLSDADVARVERTFSAEHHVLYPDASPQEIIAIALEREKHSCRFYTLLAEQTAIKSARKLFAYLASEEQKHLSRLKEELQRLLQ